MHDRIIVDTIYDLVEGRWEKYVICHKTNNVINRATTNTTTTTTGTQGSEGLNVSEREEPDQTCDAMSCRQRRHRSTLADRDDYTRAAPCHHHHRSRPSSYDCCPMIPFRCLEKITIDKQM